MPPKDDIDNDDKLLHQESGHMISTAETTTSYDPQLFITARSPPSSSLATTSIVEEVAGRPYYPNLKVENNNEQQLISVALKILFHNSNAEIENLNYDDHNNKHAFKVCRVTGGQTNTLYRISGLSSIHSNSNKHINFDTILVRLFGAEGMIDRDVETCTFAALADEGIAPPYYGRFSNGRLEGWLDHCVTMSLKDFHLPQTANEIAAKMATLHSGFKVPYELQKWHNENEPGVWSQLFSWMEQAKEISSYKSEKDGERAKTSFDLHKLEQEAKWIKTIISDTNKVGFCHNDLLPANIMKDEINGTVKLIDFEYGGVNFIAFDIANHFNEFAGGIQDANGQTDYSLFPTVQKQHVFIQSYLQSASKPVSPTDNDLAANAIDDVDEKDIQSLLKEVQKFCLVNHLFWGLWAVNQAAIEGTDSFDYLAYGINRFNRYFETKEDCMKS